MSTAALWLIIVPFFICVPLLLGIFVYRDAKSRGMNALLWALIAALCPSFVGLIAYLLVRGSYSNWKCPRCGGSVRETYTACPQCGAKLKASCRHCGGAIERDWQVCPHCAAPLDWEDRDFTPPVKPQEKGIGKIILLVILVPLLLLGLLVMAFSVSGSAGATHTAHFGEEDSLRLRSSLRPVHDDWLTQCDNTSGTIQVLTSCEEEGDQARWTYLIYLPCAVEDSIATGVESGLFGKPTLTVEYTDGGELTGLFVSMTTWGEKEPKLEVSDQYGELAVQITQTPVDLDTIVNWEMEYSYVDVPLEEGAEVYQEEHHHQ